MTDDAVILLAVAGTFLVMLVVTGIVARAIFGPDPDLAEPWYHTDDREPRRYAGCQTCRKAVTTRALVHHQQVAHTSGIAW